MPRRVLRSPALCGGNRLVRTTKPVARRSRSRRLRRTDTRSSNISPPRNDHQTSTQPLCGRPTPRAQRRQHLPKQTAPRLYSPKRPLFEVWVCDPARPFSPSAKPLCGRRWRVLRHRRRIVLRGPTRGKRMPGGTYPSPQMGEASSTVPDRHGFTLFGVADGIAT